MIDAIKNLLGLGPKANYSALVKNGATIIDVRTPDEYKGGHVEGSINIPLQDFEAALSKINKDKPVITCCASGMRSGTAKNILTSNGFAEVYNGGGWASLSRKIG
jgi:rhodanese-related sulfurtransferase